MASPSFELLRADPLTDCKNYLGFLETLANPSTSAEMQNLPTRERLGKTGITDSMYSAILAVDMNDLSILNQSRGRAYGDSALHWMGILLREESGGEAYRIGGDEFAVLLKLDTRPHHLAPIERLRERMEREARQLGFPHTAAALALVFLDQTPYFVDTVLMKLAAAMNQVKMDAETHFKVFEVRDLDINLQTLSDPTSGNEAVKPDLFRWLLINNIYQVLNMGRKLDDIQHEAYTDAISGLPNMKAALGKMEEACEMAAEERKPFSVMMIDGDNIRQYNNINYAAGDDMIRDVSAVFKSSLRPSDFVARWRTGDEFMVILPDTPLEGAEMIGERFRLAVKDASRSWRFPVTISIGVASYPQHGMDVNALIDKVEAANKAAKDRGKDRVVLAE
jgi:diguanylate cyclase (GGDEF)-like protein